MGDSGGGGGGAAATPPTAPPRGASRAALLDQRKAEVQDEVVVGALVKALPTLRRGLVGPGQPCLPASGYGKQVLKRKLCHIGGGDKPDGFDPSTCQTYRDVDQFLIEPDEDTFFGAIKAYVVTCLVSCRVAKGGSQKLQDNWSDFLGGYPTVEELEGEEVFGTIRSQVTICCGMNACGAGTAQGGFPL